MPKKNQGRAASSKPKNKTSTKAKSKKPDVKNVNNEIVKLPNVLKIALDGWLIIWRNRKTLSLIILIYGLAYLVLVLGLSSPGNIDSFKQEFFHGNLSTLDSGLSAFTYLVGSTTSSTTPAGSAYQVFIVIIASLSIIWALRQFYMGAKVRARDSYYQGLHPLAQYILILLFIALELVPLVLGLVLYGILLEGNIAVTIIEKLLSIILVLGLVGFSMYLITPSVIALYIVTLPSMTPFKALRAAKGLVKSRRWTVFRKMIFLPVLLIIAAGVTMLPFIFLLPAAGGWIFFLITLIALVYIHSYLYSLYRGLINEQT